MTRKLPFGGRPDLRLEWRCVVVPDAKDPDEFAVSLQAALSDLSSEGFVPVRTLERGGALVLMAQRVVIGAVGPVPVWSMADRPGLHVVKGPESAD